MFKDIREFETVDFILPDFIKDRFNEFEHIKDDLASFSFPSSYSSSDELFIDALLKISRRSYDKEIILFKSKQPFEWKYFERFRQKSHKCHYYIIFNKFDKFIEGYLLIPYKSEPYIRFDELENLYQFAYPAYEVLNDENNNRNPSLNEFRSSCINISQQSLSVYLNRFYPNQHSSFLNLILRYFDGNEYNAVKLLLEELLKEYQLRKSNSFFSSSWELQNASIKDSTISVKYSKSYHIRKYDIVEYYECEVSLEPFEFVKFELIDSYREYTW